MHAVRRLALLFCVTWVAGTLWTEEILMGFRPVPPYVVQQAGNTFSGLEYEIIVAALRAAGHSVKPIALPLGRLVQTFRKGTLQAAAPILPSTNSGGTLSDVYLVYNNVAMVMKSSKLKPGRIADLKGLSIVAFQTATKALGPEFAAVVEGNALYREEAEQVTQIRLLFNRRVDVVIGDSRILNHFIKAPQTGVDSTLGVEEFRLFPPTNYRVAFRDPRHASDFNRGLATIRKNGVYDSILARYR